MDKLILIAIASVASVGAWYFWHAFQSDGFSIISVVAIFALGIDNYRLRRALKLVKDPVLGGHSR